MRKKNGELSVETRAQVEILRQERYSLRQIAQRLKISVGAVRRTIARKSETGVNATKGRTGRPKITTRREDNFIVTTSKRNRRFTAPEIARELRKSRRQPVSDRTVARRLQQYGLGGRIAVKKPLLRAANIKKRYAWAKEHQDWTEEQWKTVLWTDESKFELFGSHRRTYVRRRPGERFHHECIVPTVKHGGGSVMVWGCFGGTKVGDLVKIDGTMDKKVYHNILVRHAIPSGTRILGQNFVFQQDNDPKHTSALCTTYLKRKEEAGVLSKMEWPPQSPDVSPIELLWDELDREVRKCMPTNKEDLWKALERCWNQIDSQKLDKLVKRMPRICKALIKAKGRHFDESKLPE